MSERPSPPPQGNNQARMILLFIAALFVFFIIHLAVNQQPAAEKLKYTEFIEAVRDPGSTSDRGDGGHLQG